MSRFDAHDHLVKQGWKGKGTALKNGHLTRPIPVVQKKTLSGIGKDRDESIPFWDHIFASTAASIASGQSSAAGSGTSTPVKAAPTMSIQARSSKEIAKRKLYSGFFRGKPVSEDSDDSEPMAVTVETSVKPSGSSSPTPTSEPVPAKEEKSAEKADKKRKRSSGDKSKSSEDKEERRLRRRLKKEGKEREAAERALRKAARAERRARKEEKRAAKAGKKDAEAPVDEENAEKKARKEEKEKKKEKKEKKEAKRKAKAEKDD